MPGLPFCYLTKYQTERFRKENIGLILDCKVQ